MITQQHKAVVLLRLLGPGVQEQLQALLPPEQFNRLRERLSDNAALPSARTQLQMLSEFEQILSALSLDRPSLRIHQPDDGGPQSGPEYEAPLASNQQASPRFVPSGDPLVDLERINVHQVSAALMPEQPRGIAAVLSELSPERTAELLSLFDDDRREAVVRELSATSHTHPVLIDRMADAVLARAVTMPAEAPAAIDRLQRLAGVLRAVDRPLRRRMLDAIGEQDAETAAALLERLYEFTDLADLPDRTVQRVLTEVDAATISTALYEADEALREKVLGNLSRRARESLQEEMSFQSDLPQAVVDEARKNVAAAIARVDSDD